MILLDQGEPPALTDEQRQRFDLARAALDRLDAAQPVEPTEAERKLLRRMAGR